jgi:chemotaxis protein histidine kinase CheA
MADEQADAHDEGLLALRAEYLADATERVRELSEALGRLRGRDRSALGDLQLYFHRLAGSGGLYGFPDITSRSRAAELVVCALRGTDRPLERADFAELEQHVLGIAGAFLDAQRKLEIGQFR